MNQRFAPPANGRPPTERAPRQAWLVELAFARAAGAEEPAEPLPSFDDDATDEPITAVESPAARERAVAFSPAPPRRQRMARGSGRIELTGVAGLPSTELPTLRDDVW